MGGILSATKGPTLGWFSKKKKKAALDYVEPATKFVTKAKLPDIDVMLLVSVRTTVDAALAARADSLTFTLTGAGAQMHYLIDGVTHEAGGLDREFGATVLAILKVHAGFDLAAPRPMQEGDFELQRKRKKIGCHVISQTAAQGERLMLQFDYGHKPPEKLVEAGMTPLMAAQLKAALAEKGVVAVSGPPKSGYSTAYNNTVRMVDRYLLNTEAIEDAHRPELAVDNAPVNLFNSSLGQSPLDVLPAMLRKYPDVICCRHAINAGSLNLLLDQPKEDRRIILGIQGPASAPEALFSLLSLKGPGDAKVSREALAKNIKAVLNVRVIRKLCEECKAFQPAPPQIIQQLAIPKGKVTGFYQQGPPPAPPLNPTLKPEDQPQPPPVCPGCNGLGYRGRTSVYELLVVNDAVRKALLAAKDPQTFLAACRQAGYIGIRERAITAVCRGITDFREIDRIGLLRGPAAKK